MSNLIKLLITIISISYLYANTIQKDLKRGEKVYQKSCKKFNYKQLDTKQDLKEYILKNKYCKSLNKRNFSALINYLYFSKNNILKKETYTQINVPHDHKCPVCGMFVYKYPHWSTKIEFKNSKPFYFDGVKDMMKYYFAPQDYIGNHKKNDIKNMYVSDYYSLKKIDAKKAYYVIGSTVYGPMGNELIPFESFEDAKTFMNDYNGKKILKFDEINFDNLPQ